MAHDPCERITAAEIRLENVCHRTKQLEAEVSVMEKLVTEHTVHIDQQRDWVKDHTKLHRDWNMKSWGILVAAIIAAAFSFIKVVV